jgi:hypothetical protein
MKETIRTPAESLEKQRRKHRKEVRDWRKKNPEKARQAYRKWALKLRGTEYKPSKLGAYYGAFDKNLEEAKTK